MSNTGNNEAADAEKVNQALKALQTENVGSAVKLLTEVAQRVPKTYVYQFEDGDVLNIKFWDRSEFLHYVAWMKDHGKEREIAWLGSAYPRALYHLGFIGVKAKKFNEAIELLDFGKMLEPSNPKFAFEKAMALMQMRRFGEALALFDSINEVGPHVSLNDVARAHRGRGSVAIELGELDKAESEYRESLKLEPNNKLALGELRYISQLRGGKAPVPMQSAPTSSASDGLCALCGKPFTKGKLVTIEGKTTFICEACQTGNSRTKRWWEIWK